MSEKATTMFGSRSSMGFIPSYYLAEIKAVNTNNHTCSVQLLRGTEQYHDVLLIRDPGNFNLPKIGDICVVIWDNKSTPCVIGFYPAYYKDQLDENRFYNVQEGEVVTQSRYGQKLLFNKRGEIFLTNWLSQGLEIFQNDGLAVLRSNTLEQDTAGIDRATGYAKRYSFLLHKDTNISTVTGLGGVATTGLKTIVEDSTKITEVGLTGQTIYTKKIGNYVVADTQTTAETYEVKVHPSTLVPLISETIHYVNGSIGVEQLVDNLGNTYLKLPTTATNPINPTSKLTGGLEIIGDNSNITIKFEVANIVSNEVNLGNFTDATLANLKALVKAEVLAEIETKFNNHLHGYVDVTQATTDKRFTTVPIVAVGTGTPVPITAIPAVEPVYPGSITINIGDYKTQNVKAT